MYSLSTYSLLEYSLVPEELYLFFLELYLFFQDSNECHGGAIRNARAVVAARTFGQKRPELEHWAVDRSPPRSGSSEGSRRLPGILMGRTCACDLLG